MRLLPAFLATIEAAMKMIGVSSTLMENITKFTEKFNTLMRNIGESFQNAIGVVQKLLVLAANQQKMRDLLITHVGDRNIGNKLFADIEKQAIRTGQNVNEAIQGAISFYSITADEGQVKRAYELSSILSAFSPKNLTVPDAANAIVSSVRGEPKTAVPALASNFNLPRGEVDGLVDVAETGNLDAFIDKFHEILAKEGMTRDALNYMMDSPVNKWNSLVEIFQSKLVGIGDKVMGALKPALDRLYEALASGRFDSVFDGIATGLGFVAGVISYMVNGFITAAEFIKQHWSSIQPVLSAIGIILLTVVAAALFTVLNILVMLAVAVALVLLPIELGIAMFTFLFQQLGISFSDVLVFIIGRLFVLVDVIKNLVIAPIWNAVASLAEGIVNMFVNMGYAVRKIWFDIVEAVRVMFLNILISINSSIQSVTGAVNKLISLSNEKFGTSFGTLTNHGLDVEIASAQLGLAEHRKNAPQTTDDVLSLPRMDGVIDPNGAQKNGEAFARGLINGAQNMFDNFKLPGASDDRKYRSKYDTTSQAGYPPGVTFPSMPTNIDNVGNVDNLANVGGTVDISSEDLKMMRDLAEMQAIQHFVTLTPTVQMTTGDINSGADLDTIVGHIGRKLEEEFVSTAQGVYT